MNLKSAQALEQTKHCETAREHYISLKLVPVLFGFNNSSSQIHLFLLNIEETTKKPHKFLQKPQP